MTISRTTLILAIVGVAAAVLAVGAIAYAAGARAATAASAPATAARPAQVPLQELIPLPGPGQQTPGQQPRPQQGQDCEPRILIFRDGRLYELRPGPGPDGQGRPGGPQELIPMTPYQGPPIPGLPFPPLPDRQQGPGFQPVQPRF